MARTLGRFVRFIRSIFVPATTIIGFSCLLTFFFVLYQPTRGPGDTQRLGWQSWDVIFPLSSSATNPPANTNNDDIGEGAGSSPPPPSALPASGDHHDAEVDWWNVTAPSLNAPVDSASLPLDVWSPLLPHDTGLSEIAVVRCVFDLSMIDMCTPSSSTSDDAIKGRWVRVQRDLNLQAGMWHLLLYYRRTRRRDVPLISEIQLLPSGLAPSGASGDWVKAPLSLRDGVRRAPPLFLWYRNEKTLHDMSEEERRSLITELDVVYGDGDPWYGFERISPPTTENSARSESVSITVRRGVKPPPRAPPLHFSHDGRFKIMQIADLHFSVSAGPCRDPSSPCDGGAYAYTESLVERMLDEERPDLVVFTGDQLNGQGTSWDAASVLAKFAAPVISRRIPWAAVFGNHDGEDAREFGTRRDQVKLMQGLPYGLVQPGPEDIHGVGNYVLKVWSADASKTHLLTLYFLDSGAYTSGIFDMFGFLRPTEYDFIRQIRLTGSYKTSINPISRPFTPDGAKDFGSMWEERQQQHPPTPRKLAKPNALMAPGSAKKNGGFFQDGLLHALETPHRGAGGIPEVKVVGNGHCHVTDNCRRVKGVWLCFGGGGFDRRFRIYDISDFGETIRTYKRLANEEIIDEMVLVGHGGFDPYVW
ncbi:Metallo-dependent phosphatase [Multifurca ochricompacta]|uniref:Metallo-dependent phosphatase n=1 Tax=Multifurca ochricompacta TaxID=376703 RepID=A0AAD4LV11_9AGAM|nr:Metallo-dependent phosphatase [Multifurca ochricompacta]